MSPLIKEILRKLIHLLELPIVVGYTLITQIFSQRTGILALTALLLVLLELEYLRLEYKPRITKSLVQIIERFLLRKKEKNNIVSSIFFVIAAIICFSAFDYNIALFALLMAVFGDLASAIMGVAFGKTKIFRKKSYIGLLSGLLTNTLIGYLVFPETPYIFIPMALTATVVETFTQKLDDNLTVPLFSGFAGQLIVFFMKFS